MPFNIRVVWEGDPAQVKKRRLEAFRNDFIRIIEDGNYPPERQQRLYNACMKVGIDWHEARQYVLPHALNLLRHIAQQHTGLITPDELAQLRSLQRRLGIADADATPMRDVYARIEQQITRNIAERAAYLSAAPAVQELHQRINSYDLPTAIRHRLIKLLDEQHTLAKLMAGELPIIQAPLALYRDEACHFSAPAFYVTSSTYRREELYGILAITSQRMLFLCAAGGWGLTWGEAVEVRPDMQKLVLEIVRATETGRLSCPGIDFTYFATLVSVAVKRYRPTTPLPVPPRSKRLL